MDDCCPLHTPVARATDSELGRYIEYLQAENRILRAKLPARVTVTPAERRRLVKLGLRVGPAVKELITIVSPCTFARWARDATSSIGRRKPGRPRTPGEIRQLVVQMATDSGWGTKRILGELRKLGIRKVSRSTVGRILHEHGFEPGPKRGEGTWHVFVQRHIQTLWACDFFTTKVWTWFGRVEFYVFFFLRIETRHVHVAGMTQHPNRAWMAQQGHHICRFFDGQGDRRPTHIVRDRDAKFTAEFCAILEAHGSEFRVIPPRSPNMNPFAESWVAAIKRECLNHFLILGDRHLQHLVREYVADFHDERPHQGLGNRPPNQHQSPPKSRTATWRKSSVVSDWAGCSAITSAEPPRWVERNRTLIEGRTATLPRWGIDSRERTSAT